MSKLAAIIGLIIALTIGFIIGGSPRLDSGEPELTSMKASISYTPPPPPAKKIKTRQETIFFKRFDTIGARETIEIVKFWFDENIGPSTFLIHLSEEAAEEMEMLTVYPSEHYIVIEAVNDDGIWKGIVEE